MGEAADYMLRRFAGPGVTKITKKEVRLHLDISGPNFAQNVVKHDDFKRFLGRNHIIADTHSFTCYAPAFEPVEGGGWTVDQDPDFRGDAG